MTTPPNFRRLNYDLSNPDLDKRYTPEKSCLNCEYVKMWNNNPFRRGSNEIKCKNNKLTYTIWADYRANIDELKTYELSIMCEKHNYFCKDENHNYNHCYFICDDYVKKERKQKSKKNFIIETIVMWFVFLIATPIIVYLLCLPFVFIFGAPTKVSHVCKTILDFSPLVYIILSPFIMKIYLKKRKKSKISIGIPIIQTAKKCRSEGG